MGVLLDFISGGRLDWLCVHWDCIVQGRVFFVHEPIVIVKGGLFIHLNYREHQTRCTPKQVGTLLHLQLSIPRLYISFFTFILNH